MNKLFKHTPLQSSFSGNVLALNEGKPEQLNLKEILTTFISFRKKIITKRTFYNLHQSKDKAHILVGLVVANFNIDKILDIIKKSSNSSNARQNLIKVKWQITEEISEIIIENLLKSNENDKNLIEILC